MYSLLQDVWSVKKIDGDQSAATLASLIGAGNKIIGFLFVPDGAIMVTEIKIGSGGDSIFKYATVGSDTNEEVCWLDKPKTSNFDQTNAVDNAFPPMIPTEMIVNGTVTDLYITIAGASGLGGSEAYIFYVGGKHPVKGAAMDGSV